MPSSLRFRLLQRDETLAAFSWRYPAPYELYNWRGTDAEAACAGLLRPEGHYLAVLDERDELIAFRCFGAEAQVPGGDYSEDALDLGGGLRPDLTGHGLGRQIIAAAMVYAVDHFAPRRFRTTVASFNVRAKKTCLALGYEPASTFVRPSDGLRFEVLMQPARSPILTLPLIVSMQDTPTYAL